MHEHSTEDIEKRPYQTASNVLQNSGVGRPINREERIQGNFPKESKTIEHAALIHLKLPDGVVDVEHWLQGLLRLAGWKNIEEALSHLSLPNKRLMAFPVKTIPAVRLSQRQWIHHALILAKTNEVCYQPDAPLIWTQKRMNRNIQLIDINPDKFYGLD